MQLWKLSNVVMQDIDNPSATGAVVAAGAVAAVQEMLQQSSRMHVVLLAVTPRGERCCAPSSPAYTVLTLACT